MAQLSRTDRALVLGLTPEQRIVATEADLDQLESQLLHELQEVKLTLKWQARTTVGGLVSVLAILMGLVLTR